jgi:uncharacterized damage-inducible protein DinB
MVFIMNNLARFQRELAYNAWANRETLRSLGSAKTMPDRAGGIMAHLVAAEWLWLARLGHPSPPIAVWPALSLAECEVHLRQLGQVWRRYLGSLDQPSLDREIRYTNSKGEAWSSVIADVLTHLLLHAAYHRGQIASLLGRAGEHAAYTDYIEWARRKYFDGGWPD